MTELDRRCHDSALRPLSAWGVVTAGQANYYWVRLEIAGCELPPMLCTRRARLKKLGQQVLVGDRVQVEEFDWQEFYVMGGSSIAIAVAGIVIAYLAYITKTIDVKSIAKQIEPLYKLSLNKWYFDDIYNRVFVMGSRRLARQIMEVDYRVVDGAVNLTGLATLLGGEGLKYFETGRAQFYALIVFGAVLGFVVVFSIT